MSTSAEWQISGTERQRAIETEKKKKVYITYLKFCGDHKLIFELTKCCVGLLSGDLRPDREYGPVDPGLLAEERHAVLGT